MHDAAVVRDLQGGRGLGDDVERAVGAERALTAQKRRQRLAVDQLHHQPGALGGLAEVVDRGDAGVGQTGGVAGLGAEAGPELVVADVLRPEHLHRDRTGEHGVLGPPYLAHAAHGHQLAEPVAIGQQHPGPAVDPGHGVSRPVIGAAPLA